jgi:hypothetical protein
MWATQMTVCSGWEGEQPQDGRFASGKNTIRSATNLAEIDLVNVSKSRFVMAAKSSSTRFDGRKSWKPLLDEINHRPSFGRRCDRDWQIRSHCRRAAKPPAFTSSSIIPRARRSRVTHANLMHLVK